jgi:APA family basic amino acid/polyamine antiporter
MELKRSLGLFDSVSLMFSSMVGSGIFFTTGYLLKETSEPWVVVLSWVMGGILAVSGALSYSYLARLYPKAGGDYIYLKEAYPPIVAFTSGWASLTTNFSASISVLGLALSRYLLDVFPGLDFPVIAQTSILGMVVEAGPRQIIGITAIGFFTFINLFGIHSAVKVQNTFTAIKILGLLSFVAFGFLLGSPHWSNLYPTEPIQPHHISELFLCVIPVSFAYLGWNLVTYVAEDIKDPNRNILLSTLISCGLVTMLYTLINILYLISTPRELLVGQEGIGTIAAVALFGPSAKVWISGFIGWVILGSMSAVIIGGSRIYVAMARDRLFFASFANLHPKYNSPVHALIFQFFYASLFIFFKDIESLLYMITCAILLLSTLTGVSVFILKKRNHDSSIKLPFFPWTPLFFIGFNVVLIGVIFWGKPVEALWGLGFTLTSIPAYFYFRMK